MPAYLLEGLRNTTVYRTTHAMALLAITIWCDEHRDGVYPDQFIPEAFTVARRYREDVQVNAFLLEIAARTRNAELGRIIRDAYPKATDAIWQNVITTGHALAEQYIVYSRGPT